MSLFDLPPDEQTKVRSLLIVCAPNGVYVTDGRLCYCAIANNTLLKFDSVEKAPEDSVSFRLEMSFSTFCWLSASCLRKLMSTPDGNSMQFPTAFQRRIERLVREHQSIQK